VDGVCCETACGTTCFQCNKAGSEGTCVARVMAEQKLGSLPVVDRGRVVGIVTETDVLRRIVGADACCSDVEAIVVSYP
jgi:predicted transcriptional regulator